MSTIINGTTDAITFPDTTVQNTSAVVGGKVPYSVLPTGSVLQVVQSTITSQTSTSGSTYIATGLNANITPKYTTSKILIIATIGSAYVTLGSQGSYTIVKNGNAVTGQASCQLYSSASAVEANQTMTYLDSPATTSSINYAVYMKADIGTVYAQLNSTISTIQILEIAG